MSLQPSPDIAALSVSECLTLLRTRQVGRLAVVVDGGADIFPLNYVVDHGTIVFRTAAGRKLSAALELVTVAFEVDGYDAGTDQAWSVVVRGRAELVQGLQESVEVLSLPLAPWHGSPKPCFVRLNPGEVTGRRFAVLDPSAWERPWSGTRPAAVE